MYIIVIIKKGEIDFMKDLDFNGNLKNDIELTQKKFSIPKAIINRILAAIIALGFVWGGYTLLGLSIINYALWFSLVIVVYGVLQGYDIKRKKGKFLKEQTDANWRLKELIRELERENVHTNVNQLHNSQVEETKNTSVKKYKDSIDKTKSVDRNIYFLDNTDNLQVLQEKEAITLTNGYEEAKNSLMLFEEEDLPSVQNNVEKRLVLRR